MGGEIFGNFGFGTIFAEIFGFERIHTIRSRARNKETYALSDCILAKYHPKTKSRGQFQNLIIKTDFVRHRHAFR